MGARHSYNYRRSKHYGPSYADYEFYPAWQPYRLLNNLLDRLLNYLEAREARRK